MQRQSFKRRLLSVITGRVERESGAAMSEYTVMMAGMVIVVIVGLLALGASIGGGLDGVTFADAVVNEPLQEVECAIGADADNDDDSDTDACDQWSNDDGDDDDNDDTEDSDDGGDGGDGGGGGDCPWWAWWC